MTIKQKIESRAGHDLPMNYCGFCGEGVSARLEDADAVNAFKKEHKVCKKLKNTAIDLRQLPDAPP